MKQWSILLIEDSAADCRLFRELLREIADVEPMLQIVSLLEDALVLLQARRFDVIFLDLSLPDAFGFQALKKIIHLNLGVPVYILSGTISDELVDLAVILGASGYLAKANLSHKQIAKILAAVSTDD